jgi:glutaredoxin 3
MKMTKIIEIYSKFSCPFCSRAKQLLTTKGAEYVEYDVTMDQVKRAEMVERAPGARTVPQIFIGGQAVGGFDDLNALDRAGKLDPLLAALAGT